MDSPGAPELSSEWNGASYAMFRFHQIKDFCHQAQMREDYRGWENGLWAFYRELSAQMRAPERESIKQKIKGIHEELTSLSKPLSNVEAFNLLLEAEEELEDIFFKRGNKLPTSKDPRKGMRG